eukprot:1155962-Pelagomonas_calceolata.AAC.5
MACGAAAAAAAALADLVPAGHIWEHRGAGWTRGRGDSREGWEQLPGKPSCACACVCVILAEPASGTGKEL